MTDQAPGPGQYELFFSVRGKRVGTLGTGTYGLPFAVPADQEGAHGALAVVMADMAEHICELIGIPPMEREAEVTEDAPAPTTATGPKGEFPPDLELIYQAFKGRMATEAA